MNKITTWLFICIVSTLFFACTAEKDKGDYLKGRVLIDGQPSSGVLVRLYDYQRVNDTLEYLQSQYPGIGVKVTRQLNFDKNAQSVIREVYSDKNGNWEMDNLSTGSFAVVYLKDGLCKNQYGVTVGTGGSNAGDFDFGKPFIYKNDSTITGNVTWPAGSSVYIEGKIVIDEMASLTVEPGVSIAFSDSAADYPKGELAIYGRAEFVGTEENYISFSGLGELKNAWNGVKVGERAEGKFRYCAFYNGYGAVSFIKAKPDVENCLFSNNKTGLAFEVNKSTGISKSTFLHNDDGVFGARLDSAHYTNNFFYKNTTGLYFIGPSISLISNNLFYDNENGLKNSASCTGSIKNCEFQNNKNGIYVSNNSVSIYLCNFSSSFFTDIYINTGNSNIATSENEIHNNNFMSMQYNIYQKGVYSLVEAVDIDAKNNFWSGLIDPILIADRIFDKSDAGINAQYTGNILFLPVLTQEQTNAGIVNK